jgi:hypothetical protein
MGGKSKILPCSDVLHFAIQASWYGSSSVYPFARVGIFYTTRRGKVEILDFMGGAFNSRSVPYFIISLL